MKNIIRKILKEEYQDIIELPAEIFKEYLRIYNYDMNIISNLKGFRNKKFIINGDLILRKNEKIQSLNNIVKVNGDLDLFNSNIQSLDDLEYVDGFLSLDYTKIISLPNLEYVKKGLSLYGTPIESLPKLKYVGVDLDLSYTRIQSLPKLEKVRVLLYLSNTPIQSLDNLKYVGGLDITNTPLSKTTTEDELRSKIDIKGRIYYL